LIFGGEPSKAQLEAARKAGIQYEMTPFGREAFVFFVNKNNPVDNLSSEQIRGIYSGKIKNWQELGAPVSEEIVAFQRNEGSGSQTMLEKIMAGTPIAPPLKERVSDGMGTILTQTAEYRNKNSAIGFSFRFYTLEMMRNDKLKLLSIDGIAPTKENIENGTYPFITDFYMISARPRSENTKKVVEFLAHHPQVERVNHPSLKGHPDHALYERYFPNGGGSIFTFDIKGGQEEAWKFIDHLEIFSLLANVADVKSLVIHPATTTHSQLTDEELADQNITQSTIRLSIGTEHIDDIIADLEKGFAAI
jgi:hypothetical protein